MTWQERYGSALMNTFGTPALTLVRGEGARVWDADGRAYLDLVGGIAVNSLGHAHPAIVRAVSEQVATLGHVSNLFTSEPQILLAERLDGLLGHGSKVFFSNSGAEANEAAFKLTRLTGRTHVVAAEGSFHGRTMGALALTSKAAYRTPFEPLPGHVTWVPYGDVEALAAAVTDETAAVVLEPVQGEAGVLVPSSGLPDRGPPDHQGARSAAVARRGADRHRPDGGVVRPPGGSRARPGRGDAGQGSGRWGADRRHAGDRSGRRALRPRQSRHHLRREPDGVRGRAGCPGHHRGRRPARAGDAGRQAAPRGAVGPPGGHRSAWSRA